MSYTKRAYEEAQEGEPMQGIWLVDEGVARRPKSKKEVKVYLANNPFDVLVEPTSPFGNEYEGQVSTDRVQEHGPILFVGPDPYSRRNFYGSIKVNRKGVLTVE